MLSSLQQAHIKLIENKEDFASYFESLAKSLDDVFFSDINTGLQYLAKMQVTLNALSTKAMILLDEMNAEQKTALDHLATESSTTSEWYAHYSASMLAKLTRAGLLV